MRLKTVRWGLTAALLTGLLTLGATATGAQCVKFDGLAAGTVWGNPAGHSPGDQVHVENGIRVTVQNFHSGGGATFGRAQIDPSWFTSSPHSLAVNNIGIGFDFTALPSLPLQVAIKFRDMGGTENLSINGSPVITGNLTSGSGAGQTWTVTDFPVSGGREGKLVIQGSIHSFLIGGQEFWIDTLCVTASASDRGLDHFKMYDVRDVELGTGVNLKGQWDREGKDAKVLALTHFANPVSKNGEGIRHENAHLTVYKIGQDEREPDRKVTVRNQFGTQEIETSQPVFLLVPAEKIERGSSFPAHLDHFKCYEARGRRAARGVTMRDQFISDRSELGPPTLFCLPVDKKHGRNVYRIQNPDAHLLFYELRPEDFEKTIETKDQFEPQKLQVGSRFLLGVPTKKLFTEQ